MLEVGSTKSMKAAKTPMQTAEISRLEMETPLLLEQGLHSKIPN
jgi:hypothetical protein